MKANGEFCDHCGEPADPLPGDTMTNTCENCGWPLDGEDTHEKADPYMF